MTENECVMYLVVWAQLYTSDHHEAFPIIETKLIKGENAKDRAEALVDQLYQNPAILHTTVLTYEITGNNLNIQQMRYASEEVWYEIKGYDMKHQTVTLKKIEVRVYTERSPTNVLTAEAFTCKV